MSNKHPVNLKKGTQTDPPGTGFTSSHFLLSPRVVLSSLRHQMEDRGNEDTPTTPLPPTLTSRCGTPPDFVFHQHPSGLRTL